MKGVHSPNLALVGVSLLRTFLVPVLGAIAYSGKNLHRFLWLTRKLAPNEYSRSITNAIQDNKWFFEILRRALLQLSPNCRRRLIDNLILGQFLAGSVRRTQIRNEGIRAPFFFIISPTMRCNLRCQGCYSGNYDPRDDLDLKVIGRVLQEGKELGIRFVTILGGEPFIRKDLWDLYQQHQDMMFQVYTNGTLVDKETAQRLACLGNVAVMVSIEGFEAETDARRGRGIYRKVMEAMDNLREAGVLFGFSVTVSRNNVNTILSDEFNDMLIAKGCLLGWYFLYMPIGRDPDYQLMPTPAQRLQLQRYGGINISHRKPILIIDFWNAGPYCGGCLAGGRHYFHINSRGNVEPCVFVPFAIDNVKEKSLRQILESPFFKGIRARQPYSHNYLRPCMILDHPHILSHILAEYKPTPSYPEAESLVTALGGPLKRYAEEAERLLDPVWEKEFGPTWRCWT